VKGQNPAEHSSYLKSLAFHVIHGTIETNLLRKLRLLSLSMWCQLERLRHSVTAQNTVTLLKITVQTSIYISLFQHFYGRARNCYSIAVRAVHRALVFATKGRKLKKQDMAAVGIVYYNYVRTSLSVDAHWVLHGFISSLLLQLWETRITAGCEEHNVTYPLFREGLARCNILLNRKTLADLAIWEPRTFKVFFILIFKPYWPVFIPGMCNFTDFWAKHALARC